MPSKNYSTDARNGQTNDNGHGRDLTWPGLTGKRELRGTPGIGRYAACWASEQGYTVLAMMPIDTALRKIAEAAVTGEKPPSKKQPIEKWSEEKHGAEAVAAFYRTPEQIRDTIKFKRRCGVSILTEKCGLVVADLDSAAGEAWLRKLADGREIKTRELQTHNGRHLIFKDGGVRYKTQSGEIAPGVDVRGAGGIEVIYDPSQPERHFTDLTEPVELPDWLAAVLPLEGSRAGNGRAGNGRAEGRAGDLDVRRMIREGIPPGQHDDVMKSLAMSQVRKGVFASDGSEEEEWLLFAYGILERAGEGQDADGNAREKFPDDKIIGWYTSACAVIAAEEEKDDRDVYPPPSAPMAVARQFMSELQRQERNTLHYWRASWMGWQGAQWREAEVVEIKGKIYRALEHAVFEGPEKMESWLPNKSRVANVMEAVMAISHLPMTVSPPVWLSDPDTPVRDLVSCANGLLSVSTRELRDHTPDFFTLVSVPFEYDKDAEEPVRWLRFLNDLWPGDQESINTLQEWFGYSISGRTDLQKILMMVGPPRSGKGTIARILTSLVGVRNTASPTLSSFENPFGLQPLLGKSLAIISDARLKPGADKNVIERLLSISGEDSITVERKFRESYIGTIPVRFLIISNEIPKFGDSSGAMANRFIILQLTRSWLTKEDTGLTARLMEELPGIMLWALEGLDRIVLSGVIEEPESSGRARNIISEISSPVQAFVKDRCIVSPKGEAEVQRVYEEWRAWCDDNGIVYITDKRTFGRDLHAAMPKLSNIQKRVGDKRVRCYRGLRLRK